MKARGQLATFHAAFGYAVREACSVGYYSERRRKYRRFANAAPSGISETGAVGKALAIHSATRSAPPLTHRASWTIATRIVDNGRRARPRHFP